MLRLIKKPKAPSKVITVTIDPRDLSSDLHQKLLAELHAINENKVLECRVPGEKKRPYEVKLDGQDYAIYLRYDVVPRESSKPKKLMPTYQVMSDLPFAVGSQGSIHKNKSKYKIKDGKAQTKPLNPKKPPKKTITKKEQVQGNLSEIMAVYKERKEIFDRVKHLEAKPFRFELTVCDESEEVEGHVYTVSTRFPGIDLNQLIEKLTDGDLSLTPNQLLQLAKNLVQAFNDQIVECNVVHRDIKPKNIIVDPVTLTVNFIDYDLAKLAECPDKDFTGTLGYIPKEVFRGLGTDVKSDLYALGVVLYELLGGIIGEEYDMPSMSESIKSEERKKIQLEHFEKVEAKKLNLEELGQFAYLDDEVGACLVEQMEPLIEKLLSDVPTERPSPLAILELLNKIQLPVVDEMIASPVLPTRQLSGLKLFDKGKEKEDKERPLPVKEERPAHRNGHSFS